MTKPINNGAACLSHFRANIPTLTNLVLVKAALALLNIHYAFYTHAVFSNIQAARGSLPFIPDYLLPHVDVNCADVGRSVFHIRRQYHRSPAGGVAQEFPVTGRGIRTS